MADETRVMATLCAVALSIGCHGTAGLPPNAAPSSDAHANVRGSEDERRQSVFDERVDVGGIKLRIRCEGAGLPLVVFDSGLGQGAEAWNRVWRPIVSLTRGCAYDRASRGQSDSARVPHSNRQMARELYALLTNSGEAGPYVLVGHSMGGTNVQLFLEEHGRSVAGMVLIDASPEPPPIDQIPAPALAEFERNITALEGLDLKTLLAGFDELRASKRTLSDKPLAILVAGRASDDPVLEPAEEQRFLTARQEAQRSLLRLSTNSVLVIAHNSAHHVTAEAPDTVIRAVHAVVNAARSGEKLLASSIEGSAEFQH